MSKIYKRARENHKPENIKVLFIGESPPADPSRYFYFEDVPKYDSLFLETMKTLYCCEFRNYNRKPEMKRYFLNKFMEEGYFLIDAVDHPINKESSAKQRDDLISKNKRRLIEYIQRISNGSTKIILIKKNVYELLFNDLSKRFSVLNEGSLPPPTSGQQNKYKEELARLLSKEGMIKPCIFIREDDEIIRGLLSESLKLNLGNCTVVEVKTTAEILRIAIKNVPKLLITDLYGPGGYGVDIIRSIRKKFDRIDFPILVISGNISQAAKRDLEKLNVTFMKKPFPLDALNKYLALVFRDKTGEGKLRPYA